MMAVPASLPRDSAVAVTLALGISLAPACADPDDAPLWTSRDSAGVEIVRNQGEPPEWRLSERPVLELGSVDEPGPTQFYRLRDVALLPDGGLAVANQGSEELRIFGPGGALRASVGGRGHGPREFQGLALVESFGDSLLTWDGGNQRLSVRRLDGTLERTFGLEWFDGILFPADLSGVRGGRRILAVTARYMSQLQGTGLVVDTALVSVYDMRGALVDSLARVPHNARVVQRVGNRQTTLGAPYSGGASIIADDGGFCHAFGPEPEIRCRDSDGLRRIIRVDLPTRPLTEAHAELYWEEALETANDRARDALQRMRDGMPFPDFFPAFSQLLRDDAGRIWARRYRTPDDKAEEWLIFDDGRWLARLTSPAGFEVMDIRGDRLAGVWRNPLGVEFVRLYEYRLP